jgi:general secretion pathway protein F
MKKYRYRAYDASGVLKEGEKTGVSRESVKFKLKETGYIPVSITDAGSQANHLKDKLRVRISPGTEQIEELTSRLSILLKNGIKVDSAIQYAQKGIASPRLKDIMEGIHDDIRKGIKLSDSMEKHPDIFDALYVNMVRVGEESGNLARSFSDISDALKFQRYIRSKTRQAMIYPMIILFVCAGAILFMFNFVVPRFSSLFEGETEIPFYTRLLLDATDFFRHYQFLVLILFIASFVCLYLIKDNIRVKSMLHYIAAGTPLIKNLTFTRENLRFASTLSMLLASGVVISESLEHAVDSVSNIYVKRKLGVVRKRVRHGEKLSQVLMDAGFLHVTFEGLVEVGEQTGNLAEVFSEMKQRLQKDYEDRINALLTFIEPAMIVVMGLLVGSVVVGLLMSMVSINDMVF